MFSFEPLLATETMIPMPKTIARPIRIQLVSMFCRTPSFQSAARLPPIRTTNPTRGLATMRGPIQSGDGVGLEVAALD